MNAQELDFVIKLSITFLASGIMMYYMSKVQKRKEEEAERKFQEVLRGIEMRNKIYKPKDEK